MKKIKWIMLALVLCLGLVGGAFAYWTDQVVINTTVGTAKMDVVISAAEAISGTHEIATRVLSVNGKNLDFTIDNLYPRIDYAPPASGYTNIALDIKNNSTIPVKFTITPTVHSDDASILNALRIYVVSDGTGFGPLTRTQLDTFLTTTVAGWPALAANGVAQFRFFIWLDSAVTDPGMQDASASFTFTADVKQFNQ